MADLVRRLLEAVEKLAPLLVTAAAWIAVLWLLDRLLRHRQKVRMSEGHFGRHLIMLGATVIGVLICILALPVQSDTKRDLLTVFGLVLTALITLSSTTFASNAMAGLMLRSADHFHPGDFVRVGDQFGRVTERGLFHTEIQTEDRDLTSLPNAFLIQRPITVVHATGTIVSAVVSLGYDNPPERIEGLLLEAAEAAGLQDSVVRILELRDYTVEYRVAGFLADVKQLLSMRSALRRSMLKTLHAAGIEIASPALMVQRRIPTEHSIIPPELPDAETASYLSDTTPQGRAFDKAERASRLEELRQLHKDLQARIKELELQLEQAAPEGKSKVEEELEGVRKRLKNLESAWDLIEARFGA